MSYMSAAVQVEDAPKRRGRDMAVDILEPGFGAVHGRFHLAHVWRRAARGLVVAHAFHWNWREVERRREETTRNDQKRMLEGEEGLKRKSGECSAKSMVTRTDGSKREWAALKVK